MNRVLRGLTGLVLLAADAFELTTRFGVLH